MNDTMISWAAQLVVTLGANWLMRQLFDVATAALLTPFVLLTAHHLLDVRVAHAIRTTVR